MPKKLIPFAICYDFDGTLAKGNMQERDFIPEINMSTKDFWKQVNLQSKEHNADNILIYMKLMLENAEAKQVPVRKKNFEDYGKKLKFFDGVFDNPSDNWFTRINHYAKESGVKVEHYIISAGIKEMIDGTPIQKYFKKIYASSFVYDHYGIAKWPANCINYTNKTQFLFRINKGSLEIHDHSVINKFIPKEQRTIPFEHMVYLGDGETDVPCFRLVKDQGGYSIAVREKNKQKQKQKAEELLQHDRVDSVAYTDYSDGSKLDKLIKAIIDKVSSDQHLKSIK